jgi:hypothetical protein
MNFKNLQLPDFVIADLYKDKLVITDEVTTVTKKIITAEVEPKEKWFLGDNKKNIAIVVKDATAKFINDEWLTTLGKILSVFKMNIADVAIINMANHTIDFTSLKNTLQSKYIFLFDVDTQEINLPFTIPNYQIQKYAECIFLQASAVTLSDNRTDTNIKLEKSKLLLSLKEIFN